MPSQGSTGTIAAGDQYSQWMGFVYVFNLIVGTGALTLPAAFQMAGYILSSIGIVLLALFSFMTAGWVVESMACANALNHWRRVKQLKKRGQVDDDLVTRTLENAGASGSNAESQPSTSLAVTSINSIASDSSPSSEDHEDVEDSPLIQEAVIERTMGEYYAIQERVEMGEMAKLFYSKVWVKVFYLVLCIYLYGDLAIYEAAVAKTIRDVTCTFVPPNCSQALLDSDPCFPHSEYSRLDMYRVCVCGFVGLMGPFVFFNLTKTKYMQIMTTITRWLALIVMIAWATVVIAKGTSNAKPVPARISKLPDLFGVCVYSFMCHHSLPSLLTPVSNKRHLYKVLAADYLLILLFYLLLAFTGIFAFVNIEDLYTLNFQPDPCNKASLNLVYCLQMFLLLFPVFTLSTNFPIIAITLRNNLKGLFLKENRRYSFFTTRLLFPLLAFIPPTVVALVTSNVEFLVGVTGAYAGSIIQYIVPASLVYLARKRTLKRIGMGVANPYTAPIRGNASIFLIVLWSVLCWVFVSVNLFS